MPAPVMLALTPRGRLLVFDPAAEALKVLAW
jgi:hypothetical protein